MINRPLQCLTFLLLFCFLTACTAQKISQDYNPEADKENGVVVFSVSHDEVGGPQAAAIVYIDDGRNGGVFNSSPFTSQFIPGQNDFEGSLGRLFVIKLPAGDHEFTDWQIVTGSGVRIHPGKGTPHLSVHVQSGQVKYLGNFHGNLARGRNVFGLEFTADGVISVNDRQERDLRILLMRYPQFREKIKIDLIRQGPWTSDGGTFRQIETPVVPPRH